MPPSHPELLDWLASELVASGWRLKPLHRLIVLSKTYQRSSALRAQSRQGRSGRHDALAVAAAAARGRGRARLDPRRERQAEPADGRAQLLSHAASAKCSPASRGPARAGASRMNANKAGAAFTSSPSAAWRSPSSSCSMRRTPPVAASERMVSTTGPQALTFLNGAFVHQQARHFASRLVAEAGRTAEDQVERAFALALGAAAAHRRDRGLALEFLDKQERQIRADAAATPNPRRSRRCPPQGPRSILSGRFEHERLRLQQLTRRSSMHRRRGESTHERKS